MCCILLIKSKINSENNWNLANTSFVSTVKANATVKDSKEKRKEEIVWGY